MNQTLRPQIIHKLNSIAAIIKNCSGKVIDTKDSLLIQETSLATFTHEGLCTLFERDGATENVIKLANEFGKAVATLYRNIVSFKATTYTTKLILTTQFNTKKTDKTLLN